MKNEYNDYEAFCQSRGLRQDAMSEAQYVDYLLNQEVAAHRTFRLTNNDQRKTYIRVHRR